MLVNHLYIVSKTTSSGMNIIKHGLIDKTLCFLWQKPYDIVLKTMLYRGYVYIFWHTVNSCKYPRCSTHTPRSKFQNPSSSTISLNPTQKIAKNTQNEFENEFEKVLIKPDKSSHQKYPKIAKIPLKPSFLSIKPYTLSKSVIKSTKHSQFYSLLSVHLPLKYVIKINKIIHFYLHQ